MAKKEFVCLECGAHFTIKMQQGFDILYCPSCGEELELGDCNDLDDES